MMSSYSAYPALLSEVDSLGSDPSVYRRFISSYDMVVRPAYWRGKRSEWKGRVYCKGGNGVVGVFGVGYGGRFAYSIGSLNRLRLAAIYVDERSVQEPALR